jgi:predicted deacylase
MASSLRIARGTLMVVPIVNAFGFIGHTRYLPDGRDLNRTFPGSAKGSLAARLAHLFLREVVMRSDFGVDLHSAALHRENLPQIRVDCGDAKAFELAQAFGAPVIVHSALREGSLRHVGGDRGVPIIVYEAGEGLRFDLFSVRVGEAGVRRVLAHLGMVPTARKRAAPSVVATGSSWVRASESGLFRPDLRVGSRVAAGQKIGIIGDAYGASEIAVRATFDGLIIGRSNMPAVNEGDPLFNIARVEDARQVAKHIDQLERTIAAEALAEEEEDEVV